MNFSVAKTLLNNLVDRVDTLEDGSLRIPGVRTRKEREALGLAPSLLDDTSSIAHTNFNNLTDQKTDAKEELLKLNTDVLQMPEAPSNVRVCFDFGTAMSKVTLMQDRGNGELDYISVLKLGLPGNQEEISETMLVSSVFICGDRMLWFGRSAVEMSYQSDDRHQRMDSIKQFVLRGGLRKQVAPQHNPHKEVKVTYGDIVLAYLMFLTWTVNVAVEAESTGYPRNIKRRFSMPYSDNARNQYEEIEIQLRKLLGDAQILADTFQSILQNGEGIPLKLFLARVNELKTEDIKYDFVTESIAEPVAVANTYFSPNPTNQMRSIAMVLDVGAGTTDMVLFSFWVDPTDDVNKSAPFSGTSKSFAMAGDYLDMALMEYILSKADIDHDHPKHQAIRSAILLRIREYKETLFDSELVSVFLEEYELNVEIDLREFLELDAVKKFGHSVKEEMRGILENIKSSVIDGIIGFGYLTVIITGGGADLPMIEQATSGTLSDILGVDTILPISMRPSLRIPKWLADYPDVELNYPRVAVSLGGARKNLIQMADAISTTAIFAPPPGPLERWR